MACRTYCGTFEQDLARLKAGGHLVVCPCVFFLTGGQDESDWESTFDELRSREKNRTYPNVVAVDLQSRCNKSSRDSPIQSAGERVGHRFLA